MKVIKVILGCAVVIFGLAWARNALISDSLSPVEQFICLVLALAVIVAGIVTIKRSV